MNQSNTKLRQEKTGLPEAAEMLPKAEPQACYPLCHRLIAHYDLLAE